jgi:hypothetical protein
MKLDLKNWTAGQYAVLILREDFKYSWARCGNRLGISRHAANELYKRAKMKEYEQGC